MKFLKHADYVGYAICLCQIQFYREFLKTKNGLGTSFRALRLAENFYFFSVMLYKLSKLHHHTV